MADDKKTDDKKTDDKKTDDKKTEDAPFGYTKSGRPRKRPVYNPTGKKGKHKPNQASPAGRGRKLAKVDKTGWRYKLHQRGIKFDDDQKDTYLRAIAAHGRLGSAAEAADTTGATVIRHRDNDPDFDNRCDLALLTFRDKVIDHHTRLLFEGELTKKYNKEGEVIETKHTYPIRLIELELKRQEPAYRDKQTIDFHATGGVLVAPGALSPEEWAQQQEEANTKKKSPEGSDVD